MKFTYVLVLVLVLAVVASAVNPKKAAKKAARKAAKLEAKKAKQAMKQCGDWTLSYSECDDNKMNITKTPSVSNDNCQPKIHEIECVTKKTKKNNCEITIDRSACADMSQIETSKIVITKSGCGKRKASKAPIEKLCKTGGFMGMRKNGKKNKGGTECKYSRGGSWSDCDPATNVKTREQKLKRGDPSICEPVKTVEKLCRRKRQSTECKYSRGGSWSDCDPVTNVKTREQKLKRGDPSICEPVKTVEKLCKRKNQRPNGCKYKRGQWSECDGTTNIKTMVKTLKRGDKNTCPPTQVLEKICKRQHKGLKTNCKYKKVGKWSDCDLTTGVRSREVTLKKGDPEICPLKKTATKSCVKKTNKKKGKGKACQYEKQPWSPCDAATNTVSRTLTLKEGDSTKCNSTKIQVKKCKNKHLRPHVCKYRRTSWEECDATTNMRVMIKTLKRGDPAQCEPTQTVERKCKGKKKTNVCKYKYEPWSECNITTNTMTRQQVLKSGPASCQQVKEYSKKCKKPCKFETGDWSDCNAETNQMTRIDTLKKAAHSSCPQTRVLTKKCGNGKDKKCVYDRGEWTQCDTSDNPTRTRTQKLISGGPTCEQEKVTTKSCTKKNGEVRCFFGPWSEYDSCMNGVQKKRRQVIQGGQECERKSIKMKACS